MPVERQWRTKEGGTVAEHHPVHIRVWECIRAGGYTSAPATTLREQSQRSKPCTAVEQVKEKQVKSFFQVLRMVETERGRRSDNSEAYK